MKTETKKLQKPAATTKEAKAEETNKKAITQKVIVNRELKYIYPKGCTDTLLRKAFRQKTRNTLRKLARDISKAEGKEKKDLELKMKNFSAEVLAN